MVAGLRFRLAAAVVLAAVASPLGAEEIGPPRDVDSWHEALSAAAGGELTEPLDRGWSLGVVPNIGAAIGPPDWLAYQIHVYVSGSNGRSFSLFGGVGYERGPGSESTLVTIGWGGVRRLAGARPQRGFYGKFIRYRRLDDFVHGVHQGLSVGTETGAGLLAIAFEIGAARSQRNHWAFTAQVGLKVAFPVHIPLSRAAGTEPGV
jgi:hypothetical protein